MTSPAPPAPPVTPRISQLDLICELARVTVLARQAREFAVRDQLRGSIALLRAARKATP